MSLEPNVSGSLTYFVDASGTLVAVDATWDRFAVENGAADLSWPAPSGRPVFAFISDPTTSQIYRDVMRRAREKERAATFPIRCDAPNLRRFLSIRVQPLPNGGFSFESTLLHSEPRPPIPLLDRTAPRNDELIESCGWCKRIEIDGRWHEIEIAVQRLRLFDQPRLPNLSHGICQSCRDHMESLLVG